jgi:hypothetical protein
MSTSVKRCDLAAQLRVSVVSYVRQPSGTGQRTVALGTLLQPLEEYTLPGSAASAPVRRLTGYPPPPAVCNLAKLLWDREVAPTQLVASRLAQSTVPIKRYKKVSPLGHPKFLTSWVVSCSLCAATVWLCTASCLIEPAGES